MPERGRFDTENILISKKKVLDEMDLGRTAGGCNGMCLPRLPELGAGVSAHGRKGVGWLQDAVHAVPTLSPYVLLREHTDRQKKNLAGAKHVGQVLIFNYAT